MKRRVLHIVSMLLLFIGSGIEAQVVSAEIQSIEKGVLLPRMDSVQMLNISTIGGLGDTDDGLMIYNIETGRYSFFDGLNQTWNKISSGSRGTDGIAGSDGPDGPMGPIGMSRGGAAGPGSGDIVYQCWDYNHNEVKDMNEDINNDGVWNSDDCRAAGYQGPQGPVGYSGFETVNYKHTTSSANTNLYYTFLPAISGLTSSSHIFVEGVNYNKEIYVAYSGATWYIITQDYSDIPSGIVFNVIIVE